MAHPKFTPECITELAEGEVFVFGSNLAGCHGGGAARLPLANVALPEGFVQILSARQ